MRDVAGVLGTWPVGHGPLYARLAAAMRTAIGRGDLAPGERLPPERELARQLGVSRTTAVAAYEELRRDGWVERREGSGTRVRSDLPRRYSPPIAGQEIANGLVRNAFFAALLTPAERQIDFSRGVPGPLPDLPIEVYALPPAELADLVASAGYEPLGLPALRRAIAARYTRCGLPTSCDEILVTTGAQQAISLAAALLLTPGAAAVVERPTYFGALDVLRGSGGQVVGVEVGPEGASPRELIAAARAAGARLLYTMPTFHNPTGAVMPEAARRVLTRLAREQGVVLVEDHTLADLALDREAPPPLAAFADPETPILTIGSLGKLLWPGLRVGWIRARGELIGRLARHKVVADLGSAVLGQAVAARLFPDLDEIIARRTTELRAKRDLLECLLREELPDWRWRTPAGGLFLWIALPAGDAAEFAQFAARHGVSLTTGHLMAPDGGLRDRLRLPFIHDPDVAGDGVRRLAAAWTAYRAQREQRLDPLAVVV